MESQSPMQLPFKSPDSIRTDILETFEYKGNPQQISYKTSEFSAVCPFSGLPDLATVIVEYVPDKLCIELKSLKLYYISFRDIGIFQENVTDRIFKDLWNLLMPHKLRITTEYSTRGGIDARCVMEKDRQMETGR